MSTIKSGARIATADVDKPLPTPAYPCAICYEEYSWPADELYWSDRLQNWYCDNCWDEMPEHWINDGEVEPRGISLADELKLPPIARAIAANRARMTNWNPGQRPQEPL